LIEVGAVGKFIRRIDVNVRNQKRRYIGSAIGRLGSTNSMLIVRTREMLPVERPLLSQGTNELKGTNQPPMRSASSHLRV